MKEKVVILTQQANMCKEEAKRISKIKYLNKYGKIASNSIFRTKCLIK